MAEEPKPMVYLLALGPKFSTACGAEVGCCIWAERLNSVWRSGLTKSILDSEICGHVISCTEKEMSDIQNISKYIDTPLRLEIQLVL